MNSKLLLKRLKKRKERRESSPRTIDELNKSIEELKEKRRHIKKILNSF